MAYVSILIAGYLLGIFSILILAALYLLHRPRYVAPTKRRANRDKPLPVVQPPWERNLFSELKEGMHELERRREEGIDYKWLGVTGSEQE